GTRDGAQAPGVDGLAGRVQPQSRHDHLRPRATDRRIRERRRVRHLASKVEPTHEGEDLADARAISRAETLSQGGGRVLSQQEPGPLARAVGRGEQEDPAVREHARGNSPEDLADAASGTTWWIATRVE